MKGPKALVQITGAVIAAALLLLVSAPRVAKSQVGGGGGPTLVLNPPGAPVYTQSVTQLPLESVGLRCRADGEAKTLSCEKLPVESDASGSFTPYQAPSGPFLMVTEVEIHDGNDMTASLTCSPDSTASFGSWQANGAWTNQYVIPEGIALPSGCAPTLELSKPLAGVQIFLRGYLSVGPIA